VKPSDFDEISFFYDENNGKHINKNAGLLIVLAGETYIYH
jgi:hypothetical protein